MQHNPVGWFEIYVQDMARAKKFYETVLQIKLDALPGTDLDMVGFPMNSNAPGAAGALVRMPGVPSGGNSTLVYFVSDDCAAPAARAAQNGGKIFKEKFPSATTDSFLSRLTPRGICSASIP